MVERIIIAGSGGQGIIALGKIIAETAMAKGFNVTFMPSYGAEVRGGTAKVHVIISKEYIASPVIDFPTTLVIFNEPSYKRYERLIPRTRCVLVNSSLVNFEEEGRSKKMLLIPATSMAAEVGAIQSTNIVMYGALLTIFPFFNIRFGKKILEGQFAGKPVSIQIANSKALSAGAEYMKHAASPR